MPLGVAQKIDYRFTAAQCPVIRGFMPLGVAQVSVKIRQAELEDGDSWLHAVRRCSRTGEGTGRLQQFRVIRSFMLLGVAQEPPPPASLFTLSCDSWLDAVKRCSKRSVALPITLP